MSDVLGVNNPNNFYRVYSPAIIKVRKSPK